MFSRARNVSSSIYQTLKYIWDVNKNTLLILACCKILNSWITDNYIMVRCNGLYNRPQRAKFLTALWFQNFIWIFIQRVYKSLCSSPEGECSAEIIQEPQSEQKAPLENQCMCCWHTWVSTTLCFQIFLPTQSSHSGGDAMPWAQCPWVCQLLPVWWHCDTRVLEVTQTLSAEQWEPSTAFGLLSLCPTAEISISVTKPGSLLPNPGQEKGLTEQLIPKNVAACSSSCLSSVWTCPTPWGSSSVCSNIRRHMGKCLFPVQGCILCPLIVSDAKLLPSNVF